MKDIKVWDCHVHLFPPEVYNNWEKYAAIDEKFAFMTARAPEGKGVEQVWVTAEEALAHADEAGVWGLAMQGWYWTDPGLQRLHNDYMAEMIKKYPDRLKAFACVNPLFGQESLEEAERCKKMGFTGIGELGPGSCGFDFENPQFLELCECAQQLDLPVAIHCGEPVGHVYAGKDTTPLSPLVPLVQKNPDLKLILCHMGGGLPFYEMNPKYAGQFNNVRYDCAANPLLYDIRSIRAVIDMIGADRLLFGSDYSLTIYPRKCREANMTIFVNDIRENAGLTDEEWNKVMGENFLNFVG